MVSNGMRQNWPASLPLRVSMDVKLSSLTSGAAAVTILDSALNRRYWLIAGNNGIGHAAAGELSVIITDAGNSQTVISQAHQAIQINWFPNTYYHLVLTLDDTNCSGEILQTGSVGTLAQAKIAGTPISASNADALYPGVDLVGTASSPVYARTYMVETYQVVYSGGGGGSSCPFLYSFDGKKLVFDAEPYGGAFCPALKRTEWCVLEHLKEANGRYSLLMTNELDETQYTDELKLVVVDHDSSVSIAPDAAGKIHTIADPAAPLSARDAAGATILPLIREKDGLSWQSSLSSETTGKPAAVRDTLEFEFAKPEAAHTVKLLVNASTTRFGAAMGKKFLAMHGGGLSKWYDEVDKKGPAFNRVQDWYRSEELYMLDRKSVV
jgi:hypothetical protein